MKRAPLRGRSCTSTWIRAHREWLRSYWNAILQEATSSIECEECGQRTPVAHTPGQAPPDTRSDHVHGPPPLPKPAWAMTHDDLIEIQECQDDALLGFAEALDYNQALRDIEKELEAVPTNLAVPAPASDAVQCNADPTSRRPPMTPLHERLCEPHPRVVSIQSTLSSSRVFEFGTLRAKPD